MACGGKGVWRLSHQAGIVEAGCFMLNRDEAREIEGGRGRRVVRGVCVSGG